MEGNQYRDAAGRIVEAVGKDNILSATHCATRLRLIVKDKERIDEKKLQEIGMVKGTFFNAGQYQIILGTGIVNKVYGEMVGLGLNTLSKQEQDELVKNQQKGVKRMMRMLGDIFIPIIPVIAATGLFLGLKGCVFNDNVLGLLGLSASIIPDYVVTLVNVLTETAFAFLPALICWSAFKVFGGTPVIGLVIGLMLVSPSLPERICGGYSWQRRGGSDGIFTHSHCRLSGKRSDSYPGSVSGGFHGKKLRKIMPNALDLIMTPFLVMLGTFLVVMLGIGPVMHVVELKLVTIVEMLVHLPFGIGGFLIGATYPLLVITGLHHTYTMIETSLLANTGFNPVITLCAMYGFANVGTCLAFFVKSRKQSVKSTSIGAMLSQLFGISEPVLFGIQLRYNLRPLVIMLFTSGLGAALLSVLGIQSNSYGLAVLPSYLMYIYKGNQLMWYFIISICSVACCFFLTCLFGIPQEVLEADGEPHDPAFRENQLTGKNAGEMPGEITGEAVYDMVSPADGHILPLDQVKDEVFAGRVLGDGFAVELTGGRILSPADGTIEAAFDTGHAVGIRTENGMEILIHIGINTVELGGKGFHLHVSQGQKVRRGDCLVDVDLEEVRKSGKDLTTMVIFTTGESVDVKRGGRDGRGWI
ncbi:MAG: glucose PTS transporter subunit IIA [Enterocloster bolteae]